LKNVWALSRRKSRKISHGEVWSNRGYFKVFWKGKSYTEIKDISHFQSFGGHFENLCHLPKSDTNSHGAII
jgi:hypothetical protein